MLPLAPRSPSPSPSRRELLATGSSLRLRALPPSTRPGSDWDRGWRGRGGIPTLPRHGETGMQGRDSGEGGRTLPAQGRRTDLRQPEENAGGLDELAAQDAQIGLAGQVEPVLHGRGRGKPLLRNQRVVDSERNFRVEAVADQDPSCRGRRRGCRPGAGAARARGGGRGGGGSGRGRVRPGRHSLSELHARPTQPEPGARLTSVLGATDIPVTAGFWAASRSVRFRPDVTTPGWCAPTSPFRPSLGLRRRGRCGHRCSTLLSPGDLPAGAPEWSRRSFF